MTDKSVEHRDPSTGPSEQPRRDDGTDEAGRSSNRRRIIITSLLAPPAVMTLNARPAHASNTPSMDLVAYAKAATERREKPWGK
jgi:hypothetical protein